MAAQKKFTSEQDIINYLTMYHNLPAWLKLQDKTQVFNERVEDSVKSRGSHSTDVGQIAAYLASGLTDDMKIIQKAMLLGELHDVGHIPFGHAGESIADKIIKEEYEGFSKEEKENIATIRKCLYGEKYASAKENQKPCFEHNENSVLQYYMISKELGYEVDPEIVEGILAHSTSRYPELPITLVQQAVRLADKVAYINYDVEDLKISFQGKPEWEALKKIYEKPILDPNGNEITIEYNGKKYKNVLEFLEQVEVADRIEMFIAEAIRVAKEDKAKNPEKYQNHETILTGGNDLIVSLSKLKKNSEYYDEQTKTWTQKGIEEKKRLKQELMNKSPLLYLSYEMKERSDEFIRAGTGLTNEAKKERAMNAKSATGNEDLKNQYIYNSLVAFLKNMDKIDLSKLPEHMQTTLRTFFGEYQKYKQQQEEFIRNLPGNDNHVQYPEIYTILNFIGSHSNTDLIELAKALGIDIMFEKEVLVELQALINNEKYYDKEAEKFTKEGLEARDRIVDKYGSLIAFRYGLEEDDFTPTTDEAVIEAAEQYGYREEGYEGISQEVKFDDDKKLEEFKEQDKITEQNMIEIAKQQVQNKVEQLEESNARHGR